MNPVARPLNPMAVSPLMSQAMLSALAALVALAACLQQAHAAEPEAGSAEARAALQTLLEGQARDTRNAAATQGRNSYTVRGGDTLDAIIRRTMPSSPVRIEVLREVFQKVNAGTLPARMSKPAAGTVLQIPTKDEVMQHAFGMSMPAPKAAAPDTRTAEAASYSSTALERRTWVRFP